MKIPMVKHVRVYLFVVILGGSVCVAGYILTRPLETHAREKEMPAADPMVTFMNTSPKAYGALVHVFGQVEPDRKTSLKAFVSGPLVSVSPALKVGRIVKQGTVLARIDNTSYQSRLVQAELNYANARLNLLREEQEARQALYNWQQSGFKGTPVSPLAARKPQLEAAQKEVAAARASVAAAQKEAEYCHIRAPFTGLITSKSANLGEWISGSDILAVMFATDKARIEIKLDTRQWSMLDTPLKINTVRLLEPATGAAWPAGITQDGQRLLPESRLRQVICEIDNPLEQNPPLLFGSFVSVHISGRDLPNLLKLPESSLTKKGEVWYRKGDDTLHCFKAVPVFYDNGNVFIEAPERLAYPLPVAVYPNISFVSGMPVTSKMVHMEDIRHARSVSMVY